MTQKASEVPESFDWNKVEPEPMSALGSAIAYNVRDVRIMVTSEETMGVLSHLWDYGYRVIRHPWFDRNPVFYD